jgi:hypothetical protein
MKLITTTGYGATGSSAVTDLLKEFNGVQSMGDFEFRFLQDPHGLRDLEYGLFENNNRLNTDYYIKQYKKYIHFLAKSRHYNYERYFGGEFKKISDEFIESLIDVQWDGYWHQDIIDEKPIKKFFFYMERIYQKKILRQKDSGANLYKNKMYYARLSSKEVFYKSVKAYTTKLFSQMHNQEDEFLVLDQLVPVDHNQTYLNYFEDLKIVIVDRDPRDLYLLEKYEYKEKYLPWEHVESFVKHYKLLREHKKEDLPNENVMCINFEDFIYDYDNTINKVTYFCEINKNKWIDKKKYFNPDISIKNTKKWLVYSEAKKEIQHIEKELREFLVEY